MATTAAPSVPPKMMSGVAIPMPHCRDIKFPEYAIESKDLGWASRSTRIECTMRGVLNWCIYRGAASGESQFVPGSVAMEGLCASHDQGSVLV